MALFYIDCSEGILELSSTSEINVTESATVSKFKLESGDTITDNVVNDNILISFSGLISDIKTIRNKLTDEQKYGNTIKERNFDSPVKDYITALRKVKANKELFKVRYDYRFPVAENCILTDLNIFRDSSNASGYNINLSFEQIRISKQVNIAIVRDVQRKPDQTQGKTQGGGNSTEEEDSSSKSRSLFQQALVKITDAASEFGGQ